MSLLFVAGGKSFQLWFFTLFSPDFFIHVFHYRGKWIDLVHCSFNHSLIVNYNSLIAPRRHIQVNNRGYIHSLTRMAGRGNMGLQGGGKRLFIRGVCGSMWKVTKQHPCNELYY